MRDVHLKPTLELITVPLGHGGAVAMARDRAAEVGGNFRAPHFTVGSVGMASEIAIAAGGVLFIDGPDELRKQTAFVLRSTVEMMHPDVRPEVILVIREPQPEVFTLINCLGKRLERIGELFAGWEIVSHRVAPVARRS